MTGDCGYDDDDDDDEDISAKKDVTQLDRQHIEPVTIFPSEISTEIPEKKNSSPPRVIRQRRIYVYLVRAGTINIANHILCDT